MENWPNRKTLILGRSEMIGLSRRRSTTPASSRPTGCTARAGSTWTPRATSCSTSIPGEWEAMPSYIEEPQAAACKWVSIREKNREKFDLPTVFSILIYTHPETGFPLAIVDGSYHTVMRTGAAAAVSAKWLARKDSRRLAIVGAGHMAEGALATCNEVFRLGRSPGLEPRQATRSTISSKAQQPKYPHSTIKASTDLETVVRGADVVVTVTPAREPIVKTSGSRPAPTSPRSAPTRAATRSSTGDPAASPDLRRRHPPMPHRRRDQRAPVAGPDQRERHHRRDRRSDHRQEARPHSDQEITVFDSTGIALQDSATVPLEYERAVAAGVGIEKKMIST